MLLEVMSAPQALALSFFLYTLRCSRSSTICFYHILLNTQLRTEPYETMCHDNPSSCFCQTVCHSMKKSNRVGTSTHVTSQTAVSVSTYLWEDQRLSDIGWNYEFLICPPVSNPDLQDCPLQFGKHLHCTLGRLIIWRAELSLFHSFLCLLYNNSLPPLLQKRSHLISGQFHWAAVCSDTWADSRKWEDDTLGCWGVV